MSKPTKESQIEEFKKMGRPLFDFDNPIAASKIGSVLYRITDENVLVNGKKAYYLYAEKDKISNHPSVDAAKVAATEHSKTLKNAPEAKNKKPVVNKNQNGMSI